MKALKYTRRNFLYILFASSLFVTGCDSTVDTNAAGSDEQKVTAAIAKATEYMEEEQQTVDELFLDIAGKSSGFGGAFFSEPGKLVVYLVDLDQQETTTATLRSVLDRETIRNATVVPRQAQYSFIQLMEWRRDIMTVFSHPNVISLDVDETQNRLLLGVSTLDANTESEVRQLISALPLPQEAIILEETGVPIQEADVRDLINPRVGGIRIHNDNGIFGDMICTLGFNVIFGASKRGFVTNTHCTDQWGYGADGTHFSQPGITHPVGYEVLDPDYVTNAQDPNCPAGKKCRWSDSALIEYIDPAYSNHGYIARTIAPNQPFIISGQIDNSNPTFDLYGEGPVPLVGEPVDKIGQTTGWTSGTVTQTCVDELAGFPADYLYYCQTRANYTSSGGDSGAPVFDFGNYGDGYQVPIHGIHRAVVELTGERIYSPIYNIHRDLGSFLSY